MNSPPHDVFSCERGYSSDRDLTPLLPVWKLTCNELSFRESPLAKTGSIFFFILKLQIGKMRGGRKEEENSSSALTPSAAKPIGNSIWLLDLHINAGWCFFFFSFFLATHFGAFLIRGSSNIFCSRDHLSWRIILFLFASIFLFSNLFKASVWYNNWANTKLYLFGRMANTNLWTLTPKNKNSFKHFHISEKNHKLLDFI